MRQRSRGWVIGLSCAAVVGAGVAIAFAAGIVGGAKTEPLPTAEAPPAPPPAPAPEPRDTLLQFETNVPVVVEDAAGRTPFGDQPTHSITLPRSDVPMRLVLRADGYRDLHVVVTPNQDQIFAAQLELLPQPPDAAPPEQQPEPPPPEQPTTRDRVRTKKAEPPPPPPEPEPEPEPEPTHSFSPEIRDPFGKDK